MKKILLKLGLAFGAFLFLLLGSIVFYRSKILSFQNDILKLKPADVIVLLGGDFEERSHHMRKVAELGLAKSVLYVSGYHADAPVRHLERYLNELGIDLTWKNSSNSTHSDATITKQFLLKRNFDRIILITSPYHMPRAMWVFKQIMPPDTDIQFSPVLIEQSWWKPRSKFWQFSRSLKYVVFEMIKFCIYFVRYS